MVRLVTLACCVFVLPCSNLFAQNEANIKLAANATKTFELLISKMPEFAGAVLPKLQATEATQIATVFAKNLEVRIDGKRLVIGAKLAEEEEKKVLTALVSMLRKKEQNAANQRARRFVSNALRTCILAALKYADKQAKMPARAICDSDGKPLLSWRVALLPNMGQQKLYAEFHLDEPWDSEHNKKLIPRMPRFFSENKPEAGMTSIQAIVGENCLFSKDCKQTRKMGEVRGTTRIACFAEAKDPVIWTKPADLKVDVGSLLVRSEDDILFAFVDGHVESLPLTTVEKSLPAIVSIDGKVKWW